MHTCTHVLMQVQVCSSVHCDFLTGSLLKSNKELDVLN